MAFLEFLRDVNVFVGVHNDEATIGVNQDQSGAFFHGRLSVVSVRSK
jgi:hypothetical protein